MPGGSQRGTLACALNNYKKQKQEQETITRAEIEAMLQKSAGVVESVVKN